MARKVLRWLIGTVIAASVIGAIVFALLPRPVPVDVVAATVGPLVVTVDEEGRTRIRERYVVSSPLTGRLRRITLDPGDPVGAGTTVLAVVEPTDPTLLDARSLAEAEARVQAATAAVRQAEATLEGTRAAYEHAANELEWVMEAEAHGAATDIELARARVAERQAVESLREAEFGKEITEYELEVARSALLYARGGADDEHRARMPVYSPINGVVLRVLQESMSIVSPGTPLIEVGDARDLELVIEVLSTDGVNIEPGQRVFVERWGQPRALDAIVRLVEPSAFTKVSALGVDEQRVNVVADFVTPASERAALGDGFRIEARIVVWEDNATLRIPTSAAFRHDDGWAAFIVENGAARLRAIEPGRQNERETEVVAGLAEGEWVVTHPSDQLTDGVGVRIR